MSQTRHVFDGESLITPEMFALEDGVSTTAFQDEQFATARVQFALTLRTAQQQFEAGNDAGDVTAFLVGELHKMRTRLMPAVWRQLIPIAQDHPINEFLQQDPFTAWSVEKPRGYSGDAQLLDFVYGHPSVADMVDRATPFGRAVYGFTGNAPTAVAARERCDLLAKHVDAIAGSRGADTEILTIASGHLREGDLSAALSERRIKRWIAVDQDPLSVGSVMRDFTGTSVSAINGSVKGILGGSYDLGQFDFVYAAGLYDYLPRSVAVRLARRCMRMLKPNGVFLFANYHEDLSDEAYMETFMNWTLILRSEDEMWDIINASVDSETVDASVEFSANGAMMYGIVRKRD